MKSKPTRESNIYPCTKENIEALFNFYFDIPFGDIKWIYNQREFALNQIEWTAENIAKHIDVLKAEIKASGVTVSNFMKYGLEAFYIDEHLWLGSVERKRIIKELKNRVL